MGVAYVCVRLIPIDRMVKVAQTEEVTALDLLLVTPILDLTVRRKVTLGVMKVLLFVEVAVGPNWVAKRSAAEADSRALRHVVDDGCSWREVAGRGVRLRLGFCGRSLRGGRIAV